MKTKTITLTVTQQEYEEIICQTKAKHLKSKPQIYFLSLVAKDLNNHPTAQLKAFRKKREENNDI